MGDFPHRACDVFVDFFSPTKTFPHLPSFVQALSMRDYVLPYRFPLCHLLRLLAEEFLLEFFREAFGSRGSLLPGRVHVALTASLRNTRRN